LRISSSATLAARDAEAHVVDGGVVAEGLRQVLDLDHG
jgi:hypothetical protein